MGCAFVATLCFESPFIGLEKLVMGAILGPRKPKNRQQSKRQEVKVAEGDETSMEDETVVYPTDPPPTFEEAQASAPAVKLVDEKQPSNTLSEIEVLRALDDSTKESQIGVVANENFEDIQLSPTNEG